MGKRIFKILLIFLLASACGPDRPIEIIEVDPWKNVDQNQFQDPEKKLDFSNMGDSLRRTHGLYTMVFFGDYSGILKFQQQRDKMLNQAREDNSKISCSSFAAYGQHTNTIWGRNFDNIETDMLVGYYFPPGKLRSITFTPLKFLGYEKGKDLASLEPVKRAALAFAPYYMGGGVNEKGIAVGLHAVAQRKYSPDLNKEYRYVTHWQREILDNAADFDQAIKIALSYNVFDNGLHTITHNLFIFSASGKSAIIEFHNGKWQVITNKKTWQVMTNKRRLLKHPLYCRRYSKASSVLTDNHGLLSWQQGMGLLKKMAQKTRSYSTQWSAVYDHNSKSIYICLSRDYNKVYKIVFPRTGSGGGNPAEEKTKKVDLDEISEKDFKPLSRKIEPISENRLLHNITKKEFTGNRLVLEGKGMDLVKLFKFIARDNNYKLEIDPTIKYKFFGKLQGPWDQILASLLKTYYLELVFDGEVMKIKKRPVPSKPVKYLYTISTFLLILIIVILIYFKKRPETKNTAGTQAPAIHPDRIGEVSKRFSYLFTIEKVYQQDKVSLDLVAKKLSLPRYQLSQIINSKFKLNFPEILNQYRIKDAKKQLLLTGDQKKKILEIAYAVGFNSKAAFNRSFKKATDLTPSQYREKFSNK